jgi:hypothetical protein
MISAFGVDHGQGDIEKGFGDVAGRAVGKLKSLGQGLFGGGKHAAQAGQRKATPMAGGARRAPGAPKVFGAQTGGARKAAPGGARVAGTRAGGAGAGASATPMYSQLAQKYGINQGGAHKAGQRRAF